MAHNKGNKCQQTFYRTPSCKTHHQEGGPGAHWNKSGEQKTVKEILKLRPKLIEEMYAQVCSCTQNLLIKEKFTCLHVELAIFLDYTPLNFAFILEQVMLLLCDKCSKVC